MLSKFSVKKPFTIVVAIVLVVILGVVSYTHMSVDLFPSFNMPYAVVSTSYPGASPEEVEKKVTEPLEQGLSSISNIKQVSSISSEHSSMVILQFNDDTNMDSAMLEMRESLDLITAYFPDDIGAPMIMKINPDMMPILATAVSVDGMDAQQSAKYIEEKVMPELESVEGVASVSASGLIENMVDVTLQKKKIESVNQKLTDFYQKQAEDTIRKEAKEKAYEEVDKQLNQSRDAMIGSGMTEKMADDALKDTREKLYQAADEQVEAIVKEQLKNVEIPEVEITREMISGVLSGQNFSMPSGSVEGEDGAGYTVRVGDEIRGVEELSALVIMEVPDFGAVTLSDVAEIEAYDNTGDLYSKVNGNYAVMLTIQKQAEYSTADVSNAVQAKLHSLSEKNEALHSDVLMDQGEYVNIMIDTIVKNLLFGAALAILILFIFLRRIRPTLIVGVSIVISVVFAFVLMYFSGITLNMISMGGLALGVGMLVDNSIVVIENIFRMRSEGASAHKAAIEGAREVSGAITASTLTTIVVFVPIVFTEGMTRQLFTDMALTIGFSLVASLLVALTLVPAACGGMLQKNFKARRTFMDSFASGYTRLLNHSLNHKWICITLAVVLLGVSAFAAFASGTELFPEMNSSSITVSVDMPETYTQEEEFAALDDLSERIHEVGDVQSVGVMSGGDSASMMGMGGGTTVYVLLSEDRSRSTDEIAEAIRQKTEGLSYEVSVSGSNMDMSMLSGGQIVINVYGRELDDLRDTAKLVADTVKGADGATEVDDGLGKTNQELRVRVDKEKAIAKSLTVAQVYSAVNDAIQSKKSLTTIHDGDLEYALYLKDDRDTAYTEENLGSLILKNPAGDEIKLSEIAEIQKSDGMSSIRRTGQERYVSVKGSLKPGYTIDAVQQQITEKLDSAEFPAGCRYEIKGESESIQSTFSDLLLMLVLAIVFIYLVMVAQFQSLLSPFIVMFTIPLAFTGGFIALFLCGMPVSVVSLIGLVLLVGIVVNNGIVFVDYANQQRKRGYDKREALLRAGKNRLRPILMTALTTIIALGTMVFDQSSGAELLRPMAITTIGGLLYSTLLTLFVVPAMFDLFHRKSKKKQDETKAPDTASEEVERLAEETGTNL